MSLYKKPDGNSELQPEDFSTFQEYALTSAREAMAQKKPENASVILKLLLEEEPTNQEALDLLAQVTAEKAEQKRQGRGKWSPLANSRVSGSLFMGVPMLVGGCYLLMAPLEGYFASGIHGTYLAHTKSGHMVKMPVIDGLLIPGGLVLASVIMILMYAYRAWRWRKQLQN